MRSEAAIQERLKRCQRWYGLSFTNVLTVHPSLGAVVESCDARR